MYKLSSHHKILNKLNGKCFVALYRYHSVLCRSHNPIFKRKAHSAPSLNVNQQVAHYNSTALLTKI